MVALRRILTVVGVIAVAIGLLWMAQGAGLFPYPSSSFMINQTPWILWGGILAVFGLALTWGSGRLIR